MNSIKIQKILHYLQTLPASILLYILPQNINTNSVKHLNIMCQITYTCP